jgi:hypothetical protein
MISAVYSLIPAEIGVAVHIKVPLVFEQIQFVARLE